MRVLRGPQDEAAANREEGSMSGGSMDYLYRRVEDANIYVESDLHQAFIEHLQLVAKALHDIEWVQGGDYGKGDDLEAIRAVLGKDADQLALKVAIRNAEVMAARLQCAIESAKRAA